MLVNLPVRVFCVLTVALTAACATDPVPQGNGTNRLPAGINYKEQTESYRVLGADRAAIGQGLRAAPSRNGQHFAGYFEWSLDWRYRSRTEGPNCRIVQAVITIKSVVTLPEWAPPAGVDTVLIEEWQRYSSALATHEAGHRDVVLSGATRMQRALLGLRPVDCTLIQQAAQQVAQPLMAQMRADSDKYDEATRHGATQGAVWMGAVQPWWLNQ